MKQITLFFYFLLLPAFVSAEAKIQLGIDRVFDAPYSSLLEGKKIGLITNQTGVNSRLISTISLFKQNQKQIGYQLKVLFAPEHGLYGEGYAAEKIVDTKTEEGINVLSLHGATRRPTMKMLQDIDLLVFDIQDIGSRSYTYASTLYYAMEEAAKNDIAVMVLDRPNPINGQIVDGPMLEKELRSFVGYINVPYCHGMTIGELATFFNKEEKIGCTLHVVPMKGWKRAMSFQETGISWIPTSPNIPEATTACAYPMTGIIGETSLASIGIGYTLPFKVVGAPWVKAEKLVNKIQQYNLPGISVRPIHFRPFFGSFAGKTCQGIFIVITNQKKFLPVTSQFAILSAIKELYPKQFAEAFSKDALEKSLFIKVCGTNEVLDILLHEKSPFEALKSVHKEERARFLEKREGYLFAEYASK